VNSEPAPLSEREREVLELVAQHYSSHQIAARLAISARTVDRHVENVLSKIGVHNRHEAARIYLERLRNG
jgi:DNA-binding CsgD family transcriptional regulator